MGLQHNQQFLCWSLFLDTKDNLMIISISIFHSNLSIMVFQSFKHICRILLKMLFIIIYLIVLVAVAAVLVWLGKRNSRRMRRRMRVRLDGNNQRPAFSNVSLECLQESILIIKAVVKHTMWKRIVCYKNIWSSVLNVLRVNICLLQFSDIFHHRCRITGAFQSNETRSYKIQRWLSDLTGDWLIEPSLAPSQLQISNPHHLPRVRSGNWTRSSPACLVLLV